MVDKRNRILDIINYIKGFGIELNIKKNRAQGNNGFFKFKNNGSYRIDISKDINNEQLLPTLIHEFAHFVHFCYDKQLKSLNFIFEDYNDEKNEELLGITVQNISKNAAKALFTQKNEIQNEIKILSLKLKESHRDFKLTHPCKEIERLIPLHLKYLLKYDKVKLLNKIYTVDNLDLYIKNTDIINYIKLKSKQRQLKRTNNRISKLNNYYTRPTELFARFIELYFCNNELSKKIAPICTKELDNCILNKTIPELAELQSIINN